MQKSLYTVALSIIALTSCAPFKMSVSDSLKQNQDEYTVTGRQGILIKQKMSFGEFYTTNIKRSWTKGGSSGFGIGTAGPTADQFQNLISIEYIKRKQTIHFELTDGKQNAMTYCVTNFHSKDLEIGKNPNSILNIGMDLFGIGGRSESTYYVQIYTKQNDRPWEMLIDNQAAHARSKTYTGMLTLSKEQYYTIVPVTHLEKNGKTGNALAAIGFEFRDTNGKAIAAVSLIDKGMIFMGKVSPEERLLLANACTALLLQEEIG
jgi:collagenase-like PrtC family protease